MDDLTGEQYEQVLQYMESVGEEDFSSAAAALHQHDFNMAVLLPTCSSQSTASSRRTHGSLRRREDGQRLGTSRW
jgi:hypothetical protein